MRDSANKDLIDLERGTLPRPLTLRTYLLFLIPALIALVEIQFAVQSWHLVYGFIREYMRSFDEVFADGNQFVGTFTITVIMLAIWIYKPNYRRTVVAYVIALLLASTISTLVKVTTNRARPPFGVRMETENNVDSVEAYLRLHPNGILKAEPGDYWLWLSKESPLMVAREHGDKEIALDRVDISETEGEEEGMLKASPLQKRPGYDGELEGLSVSDFNAFPSGHATSAFLLAAYLSLLFPRGKWLWYVVAVACALARVRFRRHYPGDIIAGGALGWFTLQVVFSWKWPFQLGGKVERLVERIRSGMLGSRPAGRE